jgi:hypothetical protein
MGAGQSMRPQILDNKAVAAITNLSLQILPELVGTNFHNQCIVYENLNINRLGRLVGVPDPTANSFSRDLIEGTEQSRRR